MRNGLADGRARAPDKNGTHVDRWHEHVPARSSLELCSRKRFDHNSWWQLIARAGEFFFGGVEGVRWRKPVVPGDTLMMKVEVKKFNKRFGVCKMDGKAFVGEDVVCEAELTLVMAKE